MQYIQNTANALPALEAATTSKSTSFSSFTEQAKKLQFKFSIMLNREVESITNTLMYGFINDWFGTRYLYGGTGRKGIDCSAYVGLLVNTVFAFKLPRTARLQYASTKRIKLSEMKEGDLVFFNTTGGVSHVGIYLGDGYFTHSSSSKGVTINNLKESYYAARYIGGGRIEDAAVEEMQSIQDMSAKVL